MDQEESLPGEEVEVIEISASDNNDIARDVQELDLYNEEDEDDGNDEEEDEEMMATGGTEFQEIEDTSDLVFTGHKDSVFTARLSSQDSLVVSGGQDDKAIVWSSKTGEVVLECTGHKDSVTSVGFSHDGVYVASADMSGLVKVWQINNKKNIWSFECSDIEWLEWHQMAHVLMVGTSDGECWMWKIPSGDTKTFQGHGAVAGCGKLLPDGKRLAVGYDDGCIKVWDLKSAMATHSLSGRDGHSSSVVCLDCHHDNSLILTGSTDTTSKIINSNNGKVMGVFDCGKGEENSVETCGFSKIQNYAATGTLMGKLHIWDIPTQTCRNTCQHPAGIVKLLWDVNQPVIYTACLDGAIRGWDARNGQVISVQGGHKDSILDFDVAKDGKTLVTVSEDQTSRVYRLL